MGIEPQRLPPPIKIELRIRDIHGRAASYTVTYVEPYTLPITVTTGLSATDGEGARAEVRLSEPEG